MRPTLDTFFAAKLAERKHGFRLCPGDFASELALRRALSLFERPSAFSGLALTPHDVYVHREQRGHAAEGNNHEDDAASAPAKSGPANSGGTGPR